MNFKFLTISLVSISTFAIAADTLRFPANAYRKPAVSRTKPVAGKKVNFGLMEKGVSVVGGISYIAGIGGTTAQDSDGDGETPYSVYVYRWLDAGLFDMTIRQTERFFVNHDVKEDDPYLKAELARAYIEAGRYQDAFRLLQPQLRSGMLRMHYLASLATALDGKIYPDQEAFLRAQWKGNFSDFDIPEITDEKKRVAYLSCMLLLAEIKSGRAVNLSIARRACTLVPGDPLAVNYCANVLGELNRPEDALKVLATANKTDHYELNFLLSDTRNRIERYMAARDGS
jgi:hypothetical protein